MIALFVRWGYEKPILCYANGIFVMFSRFACFGCGGVGEVFSRMKLTAKQEKFAQGVASGMTQADAYRAAFDTSKMKPETVWNKASEQMRKSEVLARVEELQAKGAELAVLTLAKHLARLEELSRDAQAAEEYNAAIKAEELRGKASGLYTERIEQKTTIEDVNKKLTAEEAKEEALKLGVPLNILSGE